MNSRQTFDIIGIPLVDARANFLKPAKFGDVIEIASRVTEFRRSSFDVEHRITVGGELAVDGGETRVWAARNKDDPEKIAAVAIPSGSHCPLWLISVAPRANVLAIPAIRSGGGQRAGVS